MPGQPGRPGRLPPRRPPLGRRLRAATSSCSRTAPERDRFVKDPERYANVDARRPGLLPALLEPVEAGPAAPLAVLGRLPDPGTPGTAAADRIEALLAPSTDRPPLRPSRPARTMTRPTADPGVGLDRFEVAIWPALGRRGRSACRRPGRDFESRSREAARPSGSVSGDRSSRTGPAAASRRKATEGRDRANVAPPPGFSHAAPRWSAAATWMVAPREQTPTARDPAPRAKE